MYRCPNASEAFRYNVYLKFDNELDGDLRSFWHRLPLRLGVFLYFLSIAFSFLRLALKFSNSCTLYSCKTFHRSETCVPMALHMGFPAQVSGVKGLLFGHAQQPSSGRWEKGECAELIGWNLGGYLYSDQVRASGLWALLQTVLLCALLLYLCRCLRTRELYKALAHLSSLSDYLLLSFIRSWERLAFLSCFRFTCDVFHCQGNDAIVCLN